MLETGIYPDFVTIDGSEGGTGAAPPELMQSIGLGMRDGLIFAHNAFVGTGLRDDIKLICAGKFVSGFDIAAKLALGADICNAARGMMFALGAVISNNTDSFLYEVFGRSYYLGLSVRLFE